MALLERVSDGEELPESVTVGVAVVEVEALDVLEGEPDADAELELELEVLDVEDALEEGEGEGELELETLGVVDGLVVDEGDELGEAVALPDLELVPDTDSVPDTVAVMLDEGLPDGDGEMLGDTDNCTAQGEEGRRRGGGENEHNHGESCVSIPRA